MQNPRGQFSKIFCVILRYISMSKNYKLKQLDYRFLHFTKRDAAFSYRKYTLQPIAFSTAQSNFQQQLRASNPMGLYQTILTRKRRNQCTGKKDRQQYRWQQIEKPQELLDFLYSEFIAAPHPMATTSTFHIRNEFFDYF